MLLIKILAHHLFDALHYPERIWKVTHWWYHFNVFLLLLLIASLFLYCSWWYQIINFVAQWRAKNCRQWHTHTQAHTGKQIHRHGHTRTCTNCVHTLYYTFSMCVTFPAVIFLSLSLSLSASFLCRHQNIMGNVLKPNPGNNINRSDDSTAPRCRAAVWPGMRKLFSQVHTHTHTGRTSLVRFPLHVLLVHIYHARLSAAD